MSTGLPADAVGRWRVIYGNYWPREVISEGYPSEAEAEAAIDRGRAAGKDPDGMWRAEEFEE